MGLWSKQFIDGYLDYFDKFYKWYLEINEKEWEYIKETFDKEDVKESMMENHIQILLQRLHETQRYEVERR